MHNGHFARTCAVWSDVPLARHRRWPLLLRGCPFGELPTRYQENVNRIQMPCDCNAAEPPRLDTAEIGALATFVCVLTDRDGGSLARRVDFENRKPSANARTPATKRISSAASGAAPTPIQDATPGRRQ